MSKFKKYFKKDEFAIFSKLSQIQQRKVHTNESMYIFYLVCLCIPWTENFPNDTIF